MENRTKCAVCNGTLEWAYYRHAYPICFSPREQNTSINDDIFTDQTFHSCSTCGCFQLTSLIDPNILYEFAHNDTYNTPTWKAHHEAFSDFILSNRKSDSIIEIGGNPNILYKKFREIPVNINYSFLDIYKPSNIPEDSTFIQGNCETCDIPCNGDIVMSHVFEHLYHPYDFVFNLKKNNVQSVFISIPNMDYLLSINTPNIVMNEHTYFINDALIRYMFSKCGFKCADFFKFMNHSYMYHFVNTNAECPELVPPKQEIHEKMKDNLKNAHAVLNTLTILPNSFFVPAGHMGQAMYHYTRYNGGRDALGFLDNDKTKWGTRVYGTPHCVYSYDKLKEYEYLNEDLHIYVFKSVYSNEIIEQIKTYNPRFDVILVGIE